jgi:inositol phosphorylceramide synthase catalytic subunit
MEHNSPSPDGPVGSSALPADSFRRSSGIIPVTAISIAYLLLSALLIGYKTDQLFLVLLFNTCYYLSGPTRRFILGFSVFIVFWILFDSMKAFPNYRFNIVHIAAVYHAEQNLFGMITPNEYWAAHSSTLLDILSGLFYLCWIPLPLAFAGWLFYKDKTIFFRFSFTFLLVNLLGFVIYYAYPAAPPWYVHLYGFTFYPHTPGNTAGLARFDQLFHVSVFASLYAKSSNVFAAMPSLHASYPLIVLFYGIKSRAGWFNMLFALIMIGIWFAAVYSGHHYVLDVLAGICCGLTGIVLFNTIYKYSGWFGRFLHVCVRSISRSPRP